MVVEDDCTAFYLLETYYNEYGEIIQYYEHYLYTICEGLIDGGVGGIPTDPEEEEEPIIKWGTVEIQGLSLIFNESGDGDESELDEDGFEVFYNKKTFAQRTSFYNIGGVHFESTQSGNVRKYYSGGEGHTGKYRFGSLTFNGASAVGGTGDPNITIEPVVTSANVYATVALNSEMRIEIWFQDKRTFIRQNGSSYVRTSGIMQAPITFIAKRIYNNN